MYYSAASSSGRRLLPTEQRRFFRALVTRRSRGWLTLRDETSIQCRSYSYDNHRQHHGKKMPMSLRRRRPFGHSDRQTASSQHLPDRRLATSTSTSSTSPPPPASTDSPVRRLATLVDSTEIEPALLYRYLGLKTFQPDEMQSVFDQIVASRIPKTQDEPTTSVVTADNLSDFLLQRIELLELECTKYGIDQDDDTIDGQRRAFAGLEAKRILQVLRIDSNNTDVDPVLTKEEFVKSLHERATAVDFRGTLPIGASMLLVGSSVGIMSPAMPFIVTELQLSSAQFGTVVSAFALSKMLGNIPSAIAVERHGRKPYLTYSLAVVALGTGGIGLAGSFEELYVCRLLTGFGVAALSTGATMMMTDVSTPLNRATTIAPIMSAFSAGAAVGPALGGYLVDQVGLHATFYVVGLSFMGVAGLNRVIMKETQSKPIRFPWLSMDATKGMTESEQKSVSTAVRDAVSQWAPLMKDSSVRSVMLMNGLYWVALAGAQMTLLPLILTDADGMAMTATQVGQVYMGMSLIQIFGNPLFAQLADRVGKAPAITGGCALISASMAGLTVCSDYTQLAAALGTWAVGSSMLSAAPVAYVSDRVSDSKRAQALALLRTWGDVGFLIGASGTGALADWSGSLDVAMLSSSGLLLTGTVWFATRQMINYRLQKTSDL